jgi:hypothetical protein
VVTIENDPKLSQAAMICNREVACSPGSRLKRLSRLYFVNFLPETKNSDKVQKITHEASKYYAWGTMRAITEHDQSR